MQAIRLQALPKFPASVDAGDGIVIERSGGVFTFSVDPGAGIFQLADADLTALAGNSANGLWARTGAGTGAARSLTGTANEITVTNGSGAAGDPTFSLPSSLTFTGKTIAGGTYSSPTLETPTATTSLTIGGAALPMLMTSPSSGATKTFALAQNGNVVLFSDYGVANRAILDLVTGNLSLLTGGLVVNSGGTTASGVSPGLSPTQFIGVGSNPAVNFRLGNNPGVGGSAFYLHWNQYDSAGTENRVASIGPGLSTAGTTAGALNASIDIALRVNNAMRSIAIAGVEGADRAGIIPDALTTWVLGQAGQGFTRIRLENSNGAANPVSLEMREVFAGTSGLWRWRNNGASLVAQVNNAAGLDFSSSSTVLTLTSSGITGTLFNAGVDLANNTLTGTTAQFNAALSDGDFATKAGIEELTNKTLTAAVAKGTWTASGTWTLPALTLGGAITYGGVTLTNAVAGTGKMVLDTSPTLVTPNIGAATATTINGAALDNTAWNTGFTPTVTSQSGTITTAAATCRYKQIGKTVHCRIAITITTAGTGGGLCFATLPVTALADIQAIAGTEFGLTGKALTGWISSATPTKVGAFYYDTTTAIASGGALHLNFVYEAA